MIGTIDVCPQTYSPDFPLDTLKSFVNSPSSIRIRNVPKKVGKWRITNVFVTVAYPDNTTRTIECVLTGGVYVATFEGCSSTGKVEKGLTISANGKDENDNDVTGYVLGKGDVEILEARENTSPGETVYYIHLLEDEPDVPTDGDMYKKDGNYVVYQNGVETQLGVSQENMESYVDQKVDEAVEEVEEAIPTKTSDLQNDSGYLSSVSWNDVENKPTIPTKTSDLTNDSNFITSTQVKPSPAPAGFAESAYYSLNLVMKDGVNYNVSSYVALQPKDNDKGATANVTVPSCVSWFLSEYNGTTYNPPIELKFGYCDSVYTIITIGGSDRKTFTNIKSFAWYAQGEREGYVIKAIADGSNFVVDEKIRIGRTEHPVTYNTAKTSIETIDGQSGIIVCTRANSSTRYITYELAYRDELSSFLPFDKVNSDTELGYALFPYSLTLHKPYNTPELYDNPTVFVAVGNIGNTENVVELCDDTKNEIMFGFNSNGVPQTKWGYDEALNNVLTWPQQGGTIATKEWVEERLAQLLSQLQS